MNPVVFLAGRRSLNITLAVVWSLVIFLQSSVPGERIPRNISPFSTAAHFLEYAILSFLLYPLLGSKSSVLLSSAYGLSDELHQFFVPGRDSSVYDLITDAIGALAGSTFGTLFNRR